jgi:tRNA splicing endonuclease
LNPVGAQLEAGHAERVRRDRNELSSMSRQTVDSDQVLADTDEQAESTAHDEVFVKGRNVEIPDHYRIYVSQ